MLLDYALDVVEVILAGVVGDILLSGAPLIRVNLIFNYIVCIISLFHFKSRRLFALVSGRMVFGT